MSLDRLKKLLYEGKQVGTLYHFTHLYWIFDILEQNKIKRGRNGWVSLTRSKYFRGVGLIPTIGLILDGDKLSHNYSIEPFSDKGCEKGCPGFEAEERVHKDIDNLNKYLKGFIINNKVLDIQLSIGFGRDKLIDKLGISNKNLTDDLIKEALIYKLKYSGKDKVLPVEVI